LKREEYAYEKKKEKKKKKKKKKQENFLGMKKSLVQGRTLT
jgi:hypothetical protein